MQSPQTTNRNYRNTAILGFIIGLFLIPTERNLAGQHTIIFIAGLVVFPLLSLLGMFIAKTFFERFRAFFEFVKYGLTGTSNTAINLGIINIFVLATGVAKGAETIIFSVVAFMGSLSNSYYWNSHWSFKTENKRTMKEFLTFGIVTLIGVVLNSGIIYLVTRITPPHAISPKLWINIAGLIATLTVLFWNYYGFRKLVFKTSSVLPEIKS